MVDCIVGHSAGLRPLALWGGTMPQDPGHQKLLRAAQKPAPRNAEINCKRALTVFAPAPRVPHSSERST